ncbi:MAG: acyl-CoA dehydrogenase [Calditrichaeota bacterium]|nr:MAG: acyl-CoA dehydrogenase [Calditrichota bacterium]MBL1205664.1 acyl-CoA dehydrogenase [Calditrichota bacterium]NOG45492.1 acyl-CoA dehydrogenase [Calditrichota bacterium]
MSEIKPSFSKALFSGVIMEDLVFPYPKMDTEEAENIKMIIESFNKFANDKINAEQIDLDAKIPDEVIDGLKELGFFGLNTPEKYDGFGLGSSGFTKMLSAISEVDGSTSLTVGAHQSIGIKALNLFGSEEQKKKFLPKLVTGELIGAFCLTEPGAGSDASGIKTKAVRDDANGYYILNGSKLWITNGGIADFFTVFAKEDVEINGETKEKISAFIVTTDLGGVSKGKEESKLGIKGSSTTEIFFEDVKVPIENLIGERGKGFKIAMEVLNSGRLGLAGGSLGGLKYILKHTMDQITQRKQFRKTIAEFEAMKEKVAQITIELYAAESMTYLTTGLVDRGDLDYSLESAMCKVFATDITWKGVNECLQMAGGLGYMKEYPYERIVRDCRINQIFEGTNEILRLFIALSGVQERGEYLKKIGKALKDPIKGFGLLTDYATDWIKGKVLTDRIREVHPSLTNSKTQFENYAKNLRFASERVLIEHGKNIMYREMITTRLADAAIDLYAMIATISRVNTRIDELGAEKCDKEIKICNTFCEQAWRRARRNLLMVDKNNDEEMKEIAELITEEKEFPFMTE